MGDGAFDAALSCLVIGFMTDPDAGVREMARVTRPGGAVAACMWDLRGGRHGDAAGVLGGGAARRARDARRAPRAGAAEGDIAARFARAGLRDVEAGTLTAKVAYSGFDDFWEPFTFGVGPAGGFLRSRTPDEQEQIRPPSGSSSRTGRSSCPPAPGTPAAASRRSVAWGAGAGVERPPHEPTGHGSPNYYYVPGLKQRAKPGRLNTLDLRAAPHAAVPRKLDQVGNPPAPTRLDAAAGWEMTGRVKWNVAPGRARPRPRCARRAGRRCSRRRPGRSPCPRSGRRSAGGGRGGRSAPPGPRRTRCRGRARRCGPCRRHRARP